MHQKPGLQQATPPQSRRTGTWAEFESPSQNYNQAYSPDQNYDQN